MDALVYIAAAGLGAGIVAGAVRATISRRDAARRTAAEQGYQERCRAERARKKGAAVASLVGRFFPFAETAWRGSVGKSDARARLQDVLAGLDAVRLGSADIGFDAVLPDAVRRQHFLALGKSGYGKTTLSLHMIRDDLDFRGVLWEDIQYVGAPGTVTLGQPRSGIAATSRSAVSTACRACSLDRYRLNSAPSARPPTGSPPQSLAASSRAVYW